VTRQKWEGRVIDAPLYLRCNDAISASGTC
jgi:hypothetical protein